MDRHVLVTGASGYIAGFIIQRLVADGWTVHGTVRNPAKHAGLHAVLGVAEDKLRLFAADLGSDAGWAEAAAGCGHALHVASPFPAGAPKSDDELVVPARDGALRVLRACRDAGCKRVVMTSSTAAVYYGHAENREFTEADWTDASSPRAYAYVKSKTIAERAARDWVAAEGGDMEFVTVNPSLVLGPVLSADASASVQVVDQLMNGKLPGCPRLGFPVVDARDVAALHVMLLDAPGVNGERFIAAGEFLWLADIARVLKERLGAKARRVPTRGLPDWLVRIAARFNPELRAVISELGLVRRVSAAHAKARLGWQTRPAADSIADCGESLARLGLVKA